MPTVDLGPCECCEGPCGEWTEQRIANLNITFDFTHVRNLGNLYYQISQGFACNNAQILSQLGNAGISLGQHSVSVTVLGLADEHPSWPPMSAYGIAATDLWCQAAVVIPYQWNNAFTGDVYDFSFTPLFNFFVKCPKNPTIGSMFPQYGQPSSSGQSPAFASTSQGAYACIAVFTQTSSGFTPISHVKGNGPHNFYLAEAYGNRSNSTVAGIDPKRTDRFAIEITLNPLP